MFDRRLDNISKEILKVRELSSEFMREFAEEKREEILYSITNEAFTLFKSISIGVMNIQDSLNKTEALECKVGREAVGIQDDEFVNYLFSARIPKSYKEKAAIRKIFNGFAHHDERKFNFSIRNGSHFILIGNKNNNSIIEFSVDDFCNKCSEVVAA